MVTAFCISPALSRVEDGRGGLGLVAKLRFPSPLIEPDVPISGIRLSGWLYREAHDGAQKGSVRTRTSKYRLCFRTDDDVTSRGFQHAQHHHGVLSGLAPASIV